MTLPVACNGCPLAGHGQSFIGDHLTEGGTVFVLRDSPGGSDIHRYGKASGLDPLSFNVASAIRCTASLPPMAPLQKGIPGKPRMAEAAIEFCDRAHGRIPPGTKLIVTRGEAALWSVSALRSSASWRGWVVPRKGFGNGWRTEVWTPSRETVNVLVHAPTGDSLTQHYDWKKVKRVLDGTWPASFPGFNVESPSVWPRVSAFDTEFHIETKRLTRFSLFDGLGIPYVVEASDVRRVPIPDGLNPTVFMHNIEADIVHLRRILSDAVHKLKMEDTMLMDSVLWSDRAHDLEYLASLYGRLNRSKHLGYDSLAYSAADAIITWDVALALVAEMKADPLSYREYRDSVYPLTPIIMEAEEAGLALNEQRLQVALDHHLKLQEQYTGRAQAYTGYPINLGSSAQVGNWLYNIEKIKAPRGKR